MNNVFNYGEQLRSLRRERGLTQEEVALRADITTSYYGQIERGAANPSVALLEKICAVMGISISDIFTNADTNPLTIDALSMQIIHQLNGKSDEEKELILSMIKTAFRLQNSKKSEKTLDKQTIM